VCASNRSLIGGFVYLSAADPVVALSASNPGRHRGHESLIRATFSTVPAADRPYPPQKLVPYEAAWAERYAVLARDLSRHLGAAWAIEHVGSTSVPGLVAKPVIDLALSLPGGQELRDWTTAFRDIGWAGPVPTGDHQTFFLHDEGIRTAIAHVFTADQWPHAHLRLFADWLRTHPADQLAYARLKARLVRQGVWGSAYTEAKKEYVQGVVNRARAAKGLAAVTL